MKRPMIPPFVRRAAELAARGRAFKRTVKVGEKTAKILVSGDAQLKYLKFGNAPFDQDLIDISQACLERNDVVWDIGANIGVFSVAAATVAKSVIAFEADIWLADLVRRTTRLPENRNLNIHVVPTAVSRDVGISKFMIAERGRASNALHDAVGRSQMGGIREEQFVPTIDINTACRDLGSPDFIKIDVEGAELGVISGGDTLFQEASPLLYIETSKESFDSISTLLSPYGYRPHTDRATLIEADQAPTANVFFAKPSHQPRLNKLRDRLNRKASRA